MPHVTIHRWEHLCGGGFAALPDTCVAVLPVAAVEHHGPHLPFGTDAMILEGVLDAAEALARSHSTPEASAVILPVQRIGWSVEHGDWPGTLSLEADRLAAGWVELGGWVARAGLRRLLILNSHGGNTPVAALAAMRLRTEHGLLAARAHWQDLAGRHDPARPAAAGGSRDWHGGHVETSVMLHLRPDLVDMRAALPPRPDPRADHLPPDGPFPWAWMARDLDPAGVIGDPGAASARVGADLVARAAAGLLALLSRLASTPWPP